MTRLAGLAVLLAACGTRAPSLPAGANADLTTTDVVRVGAAGHQVRVYGLHFGMARDEAAAEVRRHDGIQLVPDTVDMDEVDAGETSLLKLVFRGPNGTLSSFTVFAGMRPRLVGLTQRLLDGDALDGSTEVGRLLGAPDRTAVTLDIPMAAAHHTTSRWNARELEVTKQDDWPGEPPRYVFAFVKPENALFGAH